jgi:probable rRNA maturation factor
VTLQLSLQFGRFPNAAEHRRIVTPARARRWVGMALQGPAEIAVRIVGAEEGQALNREYRG